MIFFDDSWLDLIVFIFTISAIWIGYIFLMPNFGEVNKRQRDLAEHRRYIQECNEWLDHQMTSLQAFTSNNNPFLALVNYSITEETLRDLGTIPFYTGVNKLQVAWNSDTFRTLVKEVAKGRLAFCPHDIHSNPNLFCSLCGLSARQIASREWQGLILPVIIFPPKELDLVQLKLNLTTELGYIPQSRFNREGGIHR